MINYELMIRNALERVNKSDTGTRLQVYRSAMNAFEKKFGDSDPEALAAHRTVLAEAIKTIEAEHQQQPEAPPPPQNDLPVEPEPEIPYETSDNEPTTDPKQPIWATRGFLLFVGAGIVVMILSAAIAYWFFSSQSPNTPIRVKATSSNSHDTGITTAQSRKLLAADFNQNDTNFSTTLNADSNDTKLASLVKSGLLKFQNDQTLYGRKYIKIDTAKIYTGKLIARYSGQTTSGKSPLFHVGVATFDANKRLEKIKPGTHRYFVHSGTVPKKVARDKDGWFQLTGTITGTGNESHRTFRATTEYVKPYIMVSPRSPSVTVEIRSFSLEEIG